MVSSVDGLAGAAAVPPRASNVEQKNLQDDVDFRQARSSSRSDAKGIGSDRETDDAGYGVRESH
jgi:hypothetical protein